MKKRITIVLTLALIVPILGFTQRSEERNLSSFNSISVSEAINVYIKQGSSESARVEVSGIELDEVLTEVKEERLKIHLEDNNYRNIDVDVWITYRELESIEVSSAASVKTQGTLRSSSLRIESSSAGNVKLDLDLENLEVEVSSSGDVEVSGKAKTLEINVSSAGGFDGYDLVCEDAEVSANSAGTARVNVTGKIDATANSAGSIRYRGNPAKVYSDKNSGGSIKGSN